MSEITYRRVVITGTLTLQSELHIGTGTREKETRQDQQVYEFNAIVKDKEGKPYIPGSSLRGLLASLTHDTDYRERWFGQGRGKEDDHGAMGALRVYDAVAADKHETNLMSRTAIEPVTGTAKQHQLATHDRVPAGTVFSVEIGFDTKPGSVELITETEIQALLQVLAALNGAQLGTGKSVGQGALVWAVGRVMGLSDRGFQSWLLDSLELEESVAETKLDMYRVDVSALAAAVEGQAQTTWISETFKLYADSALLINDRQLVKPKTERQEHDPQLVFMRQRQGESRAVIPGSTLKGWFRARCRKILLTLNQGAREKTVDSLLDQLFGSKERASLIRFYDAGVAFTSADEHIQTFNAVDRFTGGVKDGALYTVKALRLQPNNPLEGKVSYHQDKLKGWMQLLLLFAWRDAEEGDLVVGWGKAKGYGRLRLVSDQGGSAAWIEKYREQLAGWEADLTAELAKEIK